MNAGDALWYLHAKLTMLERRYSTEPSTLEVLAQMREDITVLGDFIKVPPPPADKMQALIVHISNSLVTPTELPPTQEPSSAPAQSSGSPNSVPDRIEAVKTILDEMVASGHYDWADMIRDIHAKLGSDKPFVTDRQCRAVRNIGWRNEDFWEMLREEHLEAMSILEAAASRAD